MLHPRKKIPTFANFNTKCNYTIIMHTHKTTYTHNHNFMHTPHTHKPVYYHDNHYAHSDEGDDMECEGIPLTNLTMSSTLSTENCRGSAWRYFVGIYDLSVGLISMMAYFDKHSFWWTAACTKCFNDGTRGNECGLQSLFSQSFLNSLLQMHSTVVAMAISCSSHCEGLSLMHVKSCDWTLNPYACSSGMNWWRINSWSFSGVEGE